MFLKFDAGRGENFVKSMFATIMAANYHVPQSSEECGDDFYQIIADTNIILLLRGDARLGVLSCVCPWLTQHKIK